MRLSLYPHWKLTQLGNFAGHLNDVFYFLDALVKTEDPYSELGYERKQLEYHPQSKSAQMGKEFFAYVKELFSLDQKPAMVKCEHDYILRMRKKYPEYDWQPGMHGNKGL